MVRTSEYVAPLMGRAMGVHFARKVQGALGPLGGADGCPSRCGIDQRHDRQRAFQEGDGNVPWIAPSNFAYRMRRYMNTRHMTELSRTIRALVTKLSLQALPEMCKSLARSLEIAFRFAGSSDMEERPRGVPHGVRPTKSSLPAAKYMI